MTNNAQGFKAQLGIGASNPMSTGFEFLSESLTKRTQIIDTAGIRGTRSHKSERTRFGLTSVGGSLLMCPTAQELDPLFDWMIATGTGATSGRTFALTEAQPERYIQVLKDIKTHTYDGCKVARWSLSSSEGSQPLQLSLDVVGKTETVTDDSVVPAFTYLDGSHFNHFDAVFTFGGATREVTSIDVTCDNALDVKFHNSRTATGIDPQDRIITVSAVVPWNDTNVDLYAQALAGAAATIVWTNGAYVLTMTFATLQCPDETPTVPGRAGFPLTLNMVARTLSTTKELVVLLDSAP